MGQSLNLDAIRRIGSLVRRPALVLPHIQAGTVDDLCFDSLKKAGIRAVVFDKDNTLTAPYELAVHPVAKEGLERCIRAFGKQNVVLMSNSAGTPDDHNFVEAIAIENALGIPVLRHKEKKPGGLRELLQHFDGLTPKEICIVGDRVLTDVVFGSVNGLLTVHLSRTLDLKRDNVVAKVFRWVENAAILPLVRWLGFSPLEHASTSATAGSGTNFSAESKRFLRH